MKTAFALASTLCGLLCAQPAGHTQAANPVPSKVNGAVPAGSLPLAQLAEKINAANANSQPRVSEVVKMTEAGVDEKTILSYVESTPGFRLNADDVIYLHDNGVSATIITALLQHRPTVQVVQAPVTAPAAQAPAQTQEPAPTYAQPTQPVYSEPQVVYTQPSYVYSYPSYSYAPYYYSYSRPYCYSRPYFSFGFYGGCLPIHHFGGFNHSYHAGYRHR